MDIAVYGEGEQTLLHLASLGDPSELADVQGIAYRLDGNIALNPPRPLIADVNTIPPPAWDLFNLDLYRGRETFSLSEKSRREFLELPIQM